MIKGKYFEVAGYFQVAAYFMLPLSFASWPYAFYQILRWVVAIAFLSMLPRLTPFFGAIAIIGAIIFNPIVPLHFEKHTWQLIDMVSFVVLSLVGSKQKEMSNE